MRRREEPPRPLFSQRAFEAKQQAVQQQKEVAQLAPRPEIFQDMGADERQSLRQRQLAAARPQNSESTTTTPTTVDGFTPRTPAVSKPPRLDLQKVRTQGDPDLDIQNTDVDLQPEPTLEIEPNELDPNVDMTTLTASDVGLEEIQKPEKMSNLDFRLLQIDTAFDEIAAVIKVRLEPALKGLNHVETPQEVRRLADSMRSFLKNVLMANFNRLIEMHGEATNYDEQSGQIIEDLKDEDESQ